MVEHWVKLGSLSQSSEVSRVSWSDEWQILYTTVAIFDGISVIVWS